MQKPVVITCGDPSGIGPEIAVKAWRTLRNSIPIVWIGDKRHLPTNTPIVEVTSVTEAVGSCISAMPVLHHAFPKASTLGKPDTENAQSVIDVIKIGVNLVKNGSASALCTSPINKKVLIDGAQFAFPGHTEYLQHLTKAPTAVMMLVSQSLRVVPVTTHISIKDVPNALTPKLLRETIEITINGLRNKFQITSPRLVVAGLNPHAGEEGALGNEEIKWINPLVKELSRNGSNITGPWPADTLFHPAARLKYDAAICMYHDQALIPIKTLDFDKGVNLTLGLPIIRTSPDHGTAFDIAGRNIANPSSIIEAIKLAAKLAQS